VSRPVPKIRKRKKDEPQGSVRGSSGLFAADAKWTLIVPEQRKQKDDRQGNSEQPEQKSTTKAHVYLLS
jgi:hypothetical protein